MINEKPVKEGMVNPYFIAKFVSVTVIHSYIQKNLKMFKIIFKSNKICFYFIVTSLFIYAYNPASQASEANDLEKSLLF